MKTDAVVWEMREGQIVEYKIDDSIWVRKTLGHIKENYFTKWLRKNVDIGETFSLEDFYMKYPRHKTDQHCISRLNKVLRDYIELNVLQQMKNNSFKLVKEVK